MRIVFVCTTNVWGSAMAELMARSLLSEWDPDRQLVQVYSVGVRAQVGAPMSETALQVLAQRGLNGSEHRARWMSPEVLAAADLTLTMGEVQRNAALALNPRGMRGTFTLSEAAGLLTTLSVTSPLSPNADRHARALVAEMAVARRFRRVAAGTDDLPDIMADVAAPVRNLADNLERDVSLIIQALMLPKLPAVPVAYTAASSTSPTGAIA